MKRLLFLEDLYDFCTKNNKSFNFNAINGEEPIVVQVHGNINFKKEEKDFTEGLTLTRLQACHTDKNLNKSSISLETMQDKFLPTFKNRPILGYIHYVDGKPEFYDHRMHVEQNADGEDELVYDEVPVGIVPETNNASLEYDEKNDRYNVMVDGYIFDEYSKATEILTREEECAVSVELSISDFSYNAKEKCMTLEDGYFSGVTILGKTPDGNDVKPGMAGSNIKIADFSAKNNSVLNEDVNEKLVETLDKLNATLSKFNINEKLEEGGKIEVTKFEELLEKYGKMAEEILFEHEELSDEELEQKFAEAFEESEGDSSEEPEVEDEGEETSEEEPEETPEEAEEPEAEEEPEEGEEPVANNSRVFNTNFELSFDEIYYALNACCSVYRNDEEWCYVQTVYNDYFVMYDWDSDKIYKQSYEKDEDSIKLSGERTQVFAMLLTESEKLALEEMRSNYSVISEKLAKYEKEELDSKKAEIFSQKEYKQFIEEEEFKTLIADKDNYSLEELADKCEIAFSKCVKRKGTFAMEENKPEAKKITRHQIYSGKIKTEKKKPYGNIFKEK